MQNGNPTFSRNWSVGASNFRNWKGKPVDTQLVFDSAKNKVMHLLHLEAHAAGLGPSPGALDVTPPASKAQATVKVPGFRVLSEAQLTVLQAVKENQPCSKLVAARTVSEPPSYSYGYSCLDSFERSGLVVYDVVFESPKETKTGNGKANYSYRYRKYQVRLTPAGHKALETGKYQVRGTSPESR